ncbi:tRNA (adenosine(37)-N6)-threonylcarbamoyltransferase complex ATPase subunit type 1 TsaE [Fonticella tunisiensis]|uniref:tRNA threonylcarbamoyladenosine biosynthesis protein TsaE n=1 Tax=Fonticella tunisiensis TaxID=1096341 RepID=A0A4R7KS90_9CLOT|nr:tRNA (adenosine(37)-N6)-threonylcarbamoyltransferase complex ATPase subunit type 1 TsaE [Fonticella tunisiensis]TDT62436.1 tRNA threonylcarbamoyladenosine biosynthesis protein TsaE [Fonticella tunisiensis]
MEIITKSPEETYNLGVRLGEQLMPGDIIVLNGDLGAGKTQLTKGIAEGLGVADYITSPTFTIVNEYEGRLPLYHFDVYRIEDIYEMNEIGFEEYLFGNGVCVIEWGDMVRELLPYDVIDIYISKVDEVTRRIDIKGGDRLTFGRELKPDGR